MTPAATQPGPDAEPTPRDFRPGRRTRIIDRRGKTLPLCTPGDLPAGCDLSLRSAVRRANMHRLAYIGAVILLALAVIFVIRFITRVRSGSGSSPFSVFVAQWIAMGFSFAFGAKQIDRNGRAALAALLKSRLCPSCCYDLSATPPDPDTLTTCPECGGAWPMATHAQASL